MGTAGTAATRRKAALLACACCVLAALTVSALSAPAASKAPQIYVSLGDSYTAGPLIPNPKGDPIDCGRSDHNYPTLVANAIGPGEFRDVSCGSAKTKDMTEPQTDLPLGGTNPPQFNALGRGVDLVTVGIGGNDTGFGGIVQNCAELGVRSGGAGQPCTDHYTVDCVNQVSKRIDEVVAPRLAKVIEDIHHRSPKARLLVVGDPDPVPQPPGCYPEVPFASGDLPFLHGIAAALASMKRERAKQGGAEYVDLLTGSVGHDICQPPGTKWYEGIVPTAPAYPVHPNALGMEFAAREVLAVLAHPVPNDFAILRRRGKRSGKIVLRLRAPYRGSFIVSSHSRTRSREGPAGFRYRTREFLAPRAGRMTVRVHLRKAGRAALKRLGRVKVRLKVTFEPIAGTPATRRAAVRVGPHRLH